MWGGMWGWMQRQGVGPNPEQQGQGMGPDPKGQCGGKDQTLKVDGGSQPYPEWQQASGQGHGRTLRCQGGAGLDPESPIGGGAAGPQALMWGCGWMPSADGRGAGLELEGVGGGAQLDPEQ